MRRFFRRRAKRATARIDTFPAPTAGWVSDRNLATNAKGAARVLENGFPERESVRVRKGNATFFRDTDDGSYRALFGVSDGSQHRLIAVKPARAYAHDPDDADAFRVEDQLLRSFTGELAGQQISVAGGTFFFMVENTGDIYRYNITAGWDEPTASDAPTITGVGSATYVAPVLFKERMFFLRSDTMQVDYLPVASIGGALGSLDLRGVFREGGRLLIGGSVSGDSGAGMDDRFFVATTEGELAIYEGSNPGSDFSLVGLYRIPRPMGLRAWMRAGGDVLIATVEGLISVKQAMTQDAAALSLSAVSRPIQPEWERAAVERRFLPWDVERWDEKNMALVATPGLPSADKQFFVVNIETGAWARWTLSPLAFSHPLALATVDGRLFWATDGGIYEAEKGGLDGENLPYVFQCSLWPDDLGAPAAFKSVSSIRTTFFASTTFEPVTSVSADYEVEWPSLNGSPAIGDAEPRVRSAWASVSGGGYAIAPQVSMRIVGLDVEPEIELISMDVLYEVGGVVV